MERVAQPRVEQKRPWWGNDARRSSFDSRAKRSSKVWGLHVFRSFFNFEKSISAENLIIKKLDTKFNDQNFGHQLIQPNVDTHVLLTSEFWIRPCQNMRQTFFFVEIEKPLKQSCMVAACSHCIFVSLGSSWNSRDCVYHYWICTPRSVLPEMELKNARK